MTPNIKDYQDFLRRLNMLDSDKKQRLKEISSLYQHKTSLLYEQLKPIQESCAHKNTRKDRVYNYHTGDDYTNCTCEDCGKFLGKC